MIEFIDELPKSAVGKVLRRKLKEMEEAKDARNKPVPLTSKSPCRDG